MPKTTPFQKRLNEKMRAKRNPMSLAGLKAPVEPVPEPSAEALAAAGDLHPSRYPQHPDPTKGQVHGGVCNRTACDNGRATWWNIHTYGFYCNICGPNLNFADSAICAPVDAKPTIEEMNDAAYRADIQAAAAARRIRTRLYR